MGGGRRFVESGHGGGTHTPAHTHAPHTCTRSNACTRMHTHLRTSTHAPHRPPMQPTGPASLWGSRGQWRHLCGASIWRLAGLFPRRPGVGVTGQERLCWAQDPTPHGPSRAKVRLLPEAESWGQCGRSSGLGGVGSDPHLHRGGCQGADALSAGGHCARGGRSQGCPVSLGRSRPLPPHKSRDSWAPPE